MHSNTDDHLHEGIADDEAWQGCWRELVVMPYRPYDTPSGKVGRRFVVALVEDLRGVRDRWWTLEQLIFFQTVILQRSQYVISSHTIRKWIKKRINAWESGRHGMLMEETLRTYVQYLTVAHREDTKEHRVKTYHSLVLQGKLCREV